MPKRIIMPGESGKPDSNTVFYLRGDTLTDLGIYKIPITNYGVSVSKSNTVHGDGSLYFDGNSYMNAVIYDKWNPGSNDFTIEWWEYFTEYQSWNSGFFSNDSLQNTGIVISNSAVSIGDTPTTWNFAQWSFNRPLNSWNDMAIMRKSGTLYILMNKAIVYQTNVSGKYVSKTHDDAWIGGRRATGVKVKGYIEGFRISNIARY